MTRTDTSTIVYGPAYLDIVIRVGSPLAGHDQPPFDGGADGRFVETVARDGKLTVRCPNGSSLTITCLDPDRHPTGLLETAHDLFPQNFARQVAASDVGEHLGGMGAGFAAALGGRLVSALSKANDTISQKIRCEIERAGIDYKPIGVDFPHADSTLIITSGPFGDKLPIGLRGCHAALTCEAIRQPGHWDVVVVASLHNELVGGLLAAHPDSLRVLSPSARNCRDRHHSLARMASSTDLLVLNSGEWLALDDADRKAWQESAAIISITDGPAGAEILFPGNSGNRSSHHEPAFPRAHPPVDTNRAGEAFAAYLIQGLRDQGWSTDKRMLTQDQLRYASRMAAAASALVIDMPDFGFPSKEAVSLVLAKGKID